MYPRKLTLLQGPQLTGETYHLLTHAAACVDEVVVSLPRSHLYPMRSDRLSAYSELHRRKCYCLAKAGSVGGTGNHNIIQAVEDKPIKGQCKYKQKELDM